MGAHQLFRLLVLQQSHSGCLIDYSSESLGLDSLVSLDPETRIVFTVNFPSSWVHIENQVYQKGKKISQANYYFCKDCVPEGYGNLPGKRRSDQDDETDWGKAEASHACSPEADWCSGHIGLSQS